MKLAGALAALPVELLTSVLETLSPECCAVCGRRRGRLPWAAGLAGRAPGLRSWHAAHCCRVCLERWIRPPFAGACEGLPLWAAQRESAVLVATVGAWKYRRMCGLVRPLGALLVPALQAAAAARGPARLVPVPLHAARRRERGFDQTLQLAILAGGAAAIPVAADVLVRRRATRQQASEETDGPRRQANVAGAFAARPPRPGEGRAVALVDDLVTTGATLGAAATALRQAGWEVAWGAALGLAARLALDIAAAGSVASIAVAGAPAIDAGPRATGAANQEQA